MGQPVLLQIVLDLGPTGLQQGPDDPAPYRRDAAQALRPGAPQQVQQHRLRLILGVVGGGDIRRADGVRRAEEKVVPQPPSRLLHAQAPARRHLIDGRGLGIEGDVPLPAQAPDEILVPLGLGPHPVVQVRRRHGEAAARRDGGQIVQQAHGVPSAGHGAQDHAALRRQHVPAFHPGKQIHALTPRRRRSDSPACRRRYTPASTAAPPCRSRHGGSWPRCTRRCCAFPCPHYNSRPGTGT